MEKVSCANPLVLLPLSLDCTLQSVQTRAMKMGKGLKGRHMSSD